MMFLGFILIISTIMCLIMDGDWVRSEDVRIVNAITGYSAYNAGGFMAVVTTALSVLTHFYILITWDYSFLDGSLSIIRWILCVFTLGGAWAIGQEFRYALSGIFARR